MLIAGKAEHDPICKEQVMVEFVEVDKFEPLPSPRLLNSHLLLRQLSREVVSKKPRVIHVVRNPKDVAVSYYFHLLQTKWSGMADNLEFLDFAKEFLRCGDSKGSSFWGLGWGGGG